MPSRSRKPQSRSRHTAAGQAGEKLQAKGAHRKLLGWAGVLGATTVLASGTAFGTGFGQRLYSEVFNSAPTQSGPPIRVSSVTLLEPTGIYALPQRLTLTPAGLKLLNHLAPNDPRYDTWFRSRGGVDVNQSVVKLVLEGNRSYPVYIVNMGVREKCGPPLDGTLFFNAPPGGTVNDLGISFDLDLPRPFPQNGLLTGSYFTAHSISLKRGEPAILNVVSSTSRYCQYKFALTVVDGDRTVTEVVADHGKPFLVTGQLQDGRHYKSLYVGGVRPGASAPFRRRDPAGFSH